MTRHRGIPAVTIFSDASVDQKVGAGGWGTWIKSASAGSMTAGGSFKRKTHTAPDAEIMGIANAIVAVALKGYFAHGDTVMIQCDSMEALGIILKQFDAKDRPAPGGKPIPMRRKKLSPSQIEAVSVIHSVAAPLGLIFVVRHVKGHQPGGGRQWVNRAVDKIARDGMVKARNVLRANVTEQQP